MSKPVRNITLLDFGMMCEFTEEQKEKEQMRERIKEQRKYKRDPYGDA